MSLWTKAISLLGVVALHLTCQDIWLTPFLINNRLSFLTTLRGVCESPPSLVPRCLSPPVHKDLGSLPPFELGCSGQRGNLLRSQQPRFSPVQSEHVSLDLSPRLEETLDFGEMEAERFEEEDFEARGSRFSKSAEERQRMLVQRKDDLLQQARK